MTRKRLRLSFVPKFNGAVSGWAFRHARRNLWKCTPDYDLDDLMSEARLCFCKCVEAYPDITEAKHFFALFRTAYWRRILTIAGTRTKHAPAVAIPFTTLSDEESYAENLASNDGGMAKAEIEILKQDAPPHIRTLIERLVDVELRPRPVYRTVGEERRRESTNGFLCRIADCNPETVNMIQEVMAWLAGRDVREYRFRRLPAFAS